MESRTQGADGRPSLRVFRTVEGKKVQILRFDRFREKLPYHYDPTARNLWYDLNPLIRDDGIGRVVGQLSTELSRMVAKVGSEDLAAEGSLAEAAKPCPRSSGGGGRWVDRLGLAPREPARRIRV